MVKPDPDGYAIAEIACILDDLPPLQQPGDVTAPVGAHPHRLHRNHEFYYACPVCSRDTTELAEALVAAGYRLVKAPNPASRS